MKSKGSWQVVLLVVFGLFLFGCGSSGGGGEDSSATVVNDNAGGEGESSATNDTSNNNGDENNSGSSGPIPPYFEEELFPFNATFESNWEGSVLFSEPTSQSQNVKVSQDGQPSDVQLIWERPLIPGDLVAISLFGSSEPSGLPITVEISNGPDRVYLQERIALDEAFGFLLDCRNFEDPDAQIIFKLGEKTGVYRFFSIGVKLFHP